MTRERRKEKAGGRSGRGRKRERTERQRMGRKVEMKGKIMKQKE